MKVDSSSAWASISSRDLGLDKGSDIYFVSEGMNNLIDGSSQNVMVTLQRKVSDV